MAGKGQLSPRRKGVSFLPVLTVLEEPDRTILRGTRRQVRGVRRLATGWTRPYDGFHIGASWNLDHEPQTDGIAGLVCPVTRATLEVRAHAPVAAFA